MLMFRFIVIFFLVWTNQAFALNVAVQRPVLSNLEQPVAVTVNAVGKLGVLDAKGLRLTDPEGQSASSDFGVPGTALDLFNYKDQWFAADPLGRRLIRLNNAGKIEQVIDVTNTAESKSPPEPVAIAVYQEVIYWADRANHRICRFDLAKQAALDCFGKRGEVDGEFQYPYQMAFDRDGYLHVVDILNARLQVFDKLGRFVYQIGHFGSGPADLFRPNGIAIDSQHDLVFVSDSYFGTIKMFRAGEALGELTGIDGQPVKFKSPTGLAWHKDKLFIAETFANQVMALSINGLDNVPAVTGHETSAEPSQKNCQLCHLSWAKEGNAPDDHKVLPEASFLMCYSCHNGAVLDSRLRIGKNGQHASVYDKDELKEKRHQQYRASFGKDARKDKLPDIFPRTDKKELPCTSCHTPHTKGEGNETLYEGHKNAWLRTPNKGGDMCERCHESKIKQARELDPKNRGLNHPLAIKLAVPPKPDALGFARDKNLHDGLPKDLADKGGVLGHEQTLVCQSCHQVHGGHDNRELTALENDKGELCMACHERQASKNKEDARRKGVHPVNIKPDKPMKKDDKDVSFVSCQSCHSVHDGKLGTALLEKGIKDAEALCHTCHDRQDAKDKDDAFKKGVHPVNMKMDDEVEIDGKKTREIGCLTCHAVHSGKANTPALVEEHQDGQLCSHCHAGKQAIVGSDHDLRITAKDKLNRFKEKPSAGVCSTCHTLHRGENKVPHMYSALAVAADAKDKELQHSELKEDQLCINCHQKNGIAEKKVVKAFTHPHKDVVLRSDKKIMPLLDKKEKAEEFGEIACITCHDPHFWNADKLAQSKQQPKSVTAVGNKENVEGTALNSFLRTKGIKGTFCVDCHGLEAQTKFKYYHDPKLVRSIGVDYLK